MEKRELLKKQIVDLRVRLDGYCHDMSFRFFNGLYISDAFSSVRMGRAWLGKSLAYLGESTPYRVVDKVSDIPEASDKSDRSPVEEFKERDERLKEVNRLRLELGKAIEDINVFEYRYMGLTEAKKFNECLNNACVHLQEARFYLGFELEGMKGISDIADGVMKAVMDELTGKDGGKE